VAKVYENARFSDATVTLEADSFLRRSTQAILALVLFDPSVAGSYKIVVKDLNSHIAWVNHGYHGDEDPFGCFREICHDVGYFGLDEFLRRHSEGYFSR
jgi:hypothetical protein